MLEYDLIKQFNSSDEKAFKVVFDCYFHKLLFFANKLLPNKQECEDIVIEVFSSLFLSYTHLDSLAKIRAFLFVSVKNRCFNQLDINKNIKFRERKFNDSLSDIEEELTDQEVIKVLKKYIEELPSDCRRIIKMLLFDELTPNKISKILNIKPNTVRVHKKNAIKYLKLKLLN